jgi:conjugative transfer signal peptidase TraF
VLRYALLCCLVCLLGAAASSLGYLRVNLSPSIPIGLYVATPARGQPLRPGALALLCLPPRLAAFGRARKYLPRGSCASGIAPVGKPIFAVAGDTVEVRGGILVRNGVSFPGSRCLSVDAAGRPLHSVPDGTYLALRGTLWVLSASSPRSWDSRYYGPVPASGVQAVLHPLWVAAPSSAWR